MAEVKIVKADNTHDDVVASHYLKIWESYGTPLQDIRTDAAEVVGAFLKSGRKTRHLASFLAFYEGTPVGSVSVQLHLLPYPQVLKTSISKPGYVWSVWVEQEFRGLGVATKLMSKAAAYLKSRGCTGIVLHSSKAGEALYRSLGFEPAHEMRMTFGTDDLNAANISSECGT